jgi:hypothetical protein
VIPRADSQTEVNVMNREFVSLLARAYEGEISGRYFLTIYPDDFPNMAESLRPWPCLKSEWARPIDSRSATAGSV